MILLNPIALRKAKIVYIFAFLSALGLTNPWLITLLSKSFFEQPG